MMKAVLLTIFAAVFIAAGVDAWRYLNRDRWVAAVFIGSGLLLVAEALRP
jgi:hypothetical protein